MKILMLHGYAQSSDTFQRKTRRLEERLRTTFPNTEFTWPEGALRLRVDDIPGHDTQPQHSGLSPDLRAWFHLRYVQDPPHGLFESLDLIAGVLEREGPFDGIVAFSQGTVLAAMVASMLQEGGVRRGAYEEALRKSPRDNATGIMPYPQAFENRQHPPLKFGVLYAARVGRTSYYDWLYESPPIDTPFCQFVGMWDPMVDHEERDAVVAKLSSNENSATIVHTGGHFAPTDDDNNDRVVEFIKRCCESGNKTGPGHTLKASDREREKGYSTGIRVSPQTSRRISLAEWKRGLTVFPQPMMI